MMLVLVSESSPTTAETRSLTALRAQEAEMFGSPWVLHDMMVIL